MSKTMIIALGFALLLASCARAPLVRENATRLADAPSLEELQDDLPIEPLLRAIAAQVAFLEKNAKPETFDFGSVRFSRAEYLSGLRRFQELGTKLLAEGDRQAFFRALRDEFDFHEVYGQKDWGDVFITSYYEPLIPGSRKKTDKLTQPLYQAPDDLFSLDLNAFDPKLSDFRKLRGRIQGHSIVPYFTRKEIDDDSALANRKLEICWVDPIDAFFLQVQGSGTIELDTGERLRLNYAEKNGHPYQSLSNFLRDRIPIEKMNLHTIEAFLRTLPPAQLREYLNRNPSYVFFKPMEESALTYLGVEATDGRTIATDPKYFPKGALGFLAFEKPRFDRPDSVIPEGTEKTSRFVLDQDIGGAITGGGRVDLFWGRGAEAKHYAGAMKFRGKLYYLAPKRAK